jgi:prepilin-type N-terminal cleavage/methylation domain-containing protein
LKTSRQGGFSLLELLIVLGLIGALAAAILPGIGLTFGSQMSMALRDVSTQMRAVFDSAILTGRIHRLVINLKTGEYWAEAAPLGYLGRPPRPDFEAARSIASEDDRKKFLENLDRALSDPRKSAVDDERFYSQRSILVNQRTAFQPVTWTEVDDSVLYRKTLPGKVRFVAIATDQMSEKLQRSESSEVATGEIFFFPDGSASQAMLQFGIEGSDGAVVEDGLKYTLNLDPLTGRSQLVEGFQDAEFTGD